MPPLKMPPALKMRPGQARPWRDGGMQMSTALSLLLVGAFCYSAWLTSIVDYAVSNSRPLLIASAIFFPVGVVHGVGVWFGAW